MPRDGSRARRVADQIRREVAGLLAREVGDPRVRGITVSDVEMSADLAHARIFVTPSAGDDAARVMQGLDAASGFLRRALAPRLRLRQVPTLRFIHDTTLDEAARIDALLADLGTRGDGGEES